MELAKLPPQFKTWKELWKTLNSAHQQQKDDFKIVFCTVGREIKNIPLTIREIKEGVFREAVAEPDPENFTHSEVHTLLSSFHCYINIKLSENSSDTVLLDKLNKLHAKTYEEEYQK